MKIHSEVANLVDNTAAHRAICGDTGKQWPVVLVDIKINPKNNERKTLRHGHRIVIW